MDTHTSPLLGAHLSIAGGLEKALTRGHALGCPTIQIFTKSSNQWKERVLEQSEITRFCQERKRTGINPVISHASYLINLASPDAEGYRKSVDAMIQEVRRCEQLGIDLRALDAQAHEHRRCRHGRQRRAGGQDQLRERPDSEAPKG